ncbi:hypothetical protein ACRB68_42040 [Actinomadura sp. RB68]|uniref:Integrase n=2 Tax=Actinomadura macrotermitis TaxID=2585200 RepID=A0A7K0BY64_9ACTN|nr:hypothetical protein [Actinomadura macrotermitis]
MMLALMRWEKGHPTRREREDLHAALATWAFSVTARRNGLPEEIQKQIRLVEDASFKISALADSDVVRAVLGQLGKKLDGKPAAESTFARKRATFYNFLKYMVEKGHLNANPLPNISWTPTKNDTAVDRRRVVNEAKGRRLLIAVSRRGAMGLHLRAYFGCLFLAGLRPGEAAALTLDELELPDNDDEPGWMHLTASSPEVGGPWTDSGEREIRQLKHRAVNAVRPVPMSPLLCRLIRAHLEIFGTAPDGRLFRSEDGGLVSDSTVNTI